MLKSLNPDSYKKLFSSQAWALCLTYAYDFVLSESVYFYRRYAHNDKTGIQWTPGSQIYHSNQETIFGVKRFLNKRIKKTYKLCMILCLIMLATNTIFTDYVHITLKKALCKVSASSLIDFLSKERKSAKNA